MLYQTEKYLSDARMQATPHYVAWSREPPGIVVDTIGGKRKEKPRSSAIFQTSKTRTCARLKIRTGCLAHTLLRLVERAQRERNAGLLACQPGNALCCFNQSPSQPPRAATN